MRPDGITVLPPIGNKAGVFCILEHKCVSDVTDQYLLRTKLTTENQYESLRSALSDTIRHQVWKVEQISFVAGSRSANEEDLRKNSHPCGIHGLALRERVGPKEKVFFEYRRLASDSGNVFLCHISEVRSRHIFWFVPDR